MSGGEAIRGIRMEYSRSREPPVSQSEHTIVQGHFTYYAVPGNINSLGVFRDRLTGALVAYTSPPKPETPDFLDT
jgi:hypothetical protein